MRCKILRLTPNARMPTKGYGSEDAGWDLYASEDVLIEPFKRVLIPTGLVLGPEPGYWIEIRGRSSSPIRILSSVIDNGFRGELAIGVEVDHTPYQVIQGDKLAQMIFHKILPVEWDEVYHPEYLPKSNRGDRGFGSSGN